MLSFKSKCAALVITSQLRLSDNATSASTPREVCVAKSTAPIGRPGGAARDVLALMSNHAAVTPTRSCQSFAFTPISVCFPSRLGNCRPAVSRLLFG